MLFIRTKTKKLQIFGVIPLIKPQNDKYIYKHGAGGGGGGRKRDTERDTQTDGTRERDRQTETESRRDKERETETGARDRSQRRRDRDRGRDTDTERVLRRNNPASYNDIDLNGGITILKLMKSMNIATSFKPIAYELQTYSLHKCLLQLLSLGVACTRTQ